MRTRLVAAFVLGIGFASGSSALAQTTQTAQPAPTAAEKEAARERYKKGVKLFDLAEQKKDPEVYEQSYTEFAQAFAVWPDDKVLWNLAIAELETKRYVQALHHFREYDQRRHVLVGPKSADRAALAKYIEDASRATGHLDVASTPGARITVDGKEVGRAPFSEPLDVMPGAHVLVASSASGTKEAHVTAAAGETSRVALAIDEPAAAAQVPVVEAAPVVTSGVVPAEQPQAAESWWTTRHDVGVGLLAVSAAAIAGTVVFALKSGDERDSYDAQRTTLNGACANAAAPGCDELHATKQRIDTDSALAIGMGVVAAGTLGAGLYLTLTKSEPKKMGGVTLMPFASMFGGGLQVKGDL